MRSERERELREARAAAAALRASLPPEERAAQPSSRFPASRRTRIRPMAGTGQTLDGRIVTDVDDAEGEIPPPYHPREHDAEMDEESEDEEE